MYWLPFKTLDDQFLTSSLVGPLEVELKDREDDKDGTNFDGLEYRYW